mmetsp:Transcript_2103/g.5152  ORF Transcript_2103/g.5152 Transcript_2103/m.5152 type:complete len:320 (-) Transcript_2103:334-1293(-)
MRSREVVVFLQRHRSVEAAWRVVCHEKVAQDEVVIGIFGLAKRLRRVGGREHASQPRPVATRSRTCRTHLREEVLRGGNGSDEVVPCALNRIVRQLEVHLASKIKFHAIQILPLGNVVAHLDAYEPLLLRVVERHVPSGCQFATDHCVHPELLVVFQAFCVHIPGRFHPGEFEVRLHYHDIVRAVEVPGATGGYHREVKFVRREDVLTLVCRKVILQERFVASLQFALHVTQDAIEASHRVQRAAEVILDHVPMVKILPLGAHPADVCAPRTSVLQALPPVVGQPENALAVHQNVRGPLGNRTAAFQRRTIALLWRRRL